MKTNKSYWIWRIKNLLLINTLTSERKWKLRKLNNSSYSFPTGPSTFDPSLASIRNDNEFCLQIDGDIELSSSASFHLGRYNLNYYITFRKFIDFDNFKH